MLHFCSGRQRKTRKWKSHTGQTEEKMVVGVVVSSNENDRLDEGQELLVDLCDTEEQLGNMTVRELMEKINLKLLQEFPPKPGCYAGSAYEVHFKEQKLEEDSFLSDHGIENMSKVEVKIYSSIPESDLMGALIGHGGVEKDLTEDEKDNKRHRSKDIVYDMEQPLQFSVKQERQSSSQCCCFS